ncbi:hypothetical protein AVEN_183557-1 [Araneus ventricosus]|uniref:Pre-C2HC domain-containing protein n=1 Tax=Araneus ventricosus TaxID=182803 RepID=A0A4Y2FG75_ARAVE|nr:hypothetical protein AVEN_183557-1 [Araneus ventricosus]
MPDRQDYNVNKDLITKTFERKNNAARIRAINKINKGGVKIAVADENEVKAVKLSLESDNEISDNFEMYIPRRRIPQVIVYNIDKDIENEKDILDGIFAKNIFLVDKNKEPLVNVNCKIPTRNPNFNHWVLSVSPSIFSTLMTKEGIYLQFRRFNFAEFLNVKQCRPCLNYGHTAKYCETLDSPAGCDRCGWSKTDEDNHNNCRIYKCYHCSLARKIYGVNYGTNHSALDKKCKCYEKQKKLLMERTDYV